MTSQVQQTTGMTVSFSFTDANGAERRSLRNFFPSRGAERPRLLEDSVFMEPGAEARLKTYFSSPVEGQIDVTDDVITTAVTAHGSW